MGFFRSQFRVGWLPLAVAAIVLSFGGSPRAEAKPHGKLTVQFIYYVSEEEAQRNARIVNYAAQTAWLATNETTGGWPKEFRRDLNGDGQSELFLYVTGHAHFAGYSIFTRRAGKWSYIGSCDYGGTAPVRLRGERAGWHDFSIDIEGSRGALDQHYFRFDPRDKTYDLSYIQRIRKEEVDPSVERN